MKYLFQSITETDVADYLSLKAPETKIAEFANSVDPDKAAHYELPHLDLPCSPSSL